MEKIVENGLVGFFDILGYQSILNKNSVNECARIIKTVLAKIPGQIKKYMIYGTPEGEVGDSVSETLKDFFRNHFKTIMVSDSVLFLVDYEGIPDDDKDFLVMTTLYYLLFFIKETLRSGFPMRACLDFGPFYYYNNIFAGNTIVSSHSAGALLNFSGLVVSDSALEYLRTIRSSSGYTGSFLKDYIFEYLVAVKPERDEYRNVLIPYIDADQKLDIRQFIFESFHMHNKDVDTRTLEKISNTEKIMRYGVHKRKER